MGTTSDDLKAFIKVPQTTNFAELKRIKDKLSFNLDKVNFLVWLAFLCVVTWFVGVAVFMCVSW